MRREVPSKIAFWLGFIVVMVGLKVLHHLEVKTDYVDRIYKDLQENYPCSPKED